MDTKLILDRLRSNRYKFFATITGGGTKAIAELLENGGASSVFVGCEVPYGYNVTEKPPTKYVSEAYAKELAAYGMNKIYATGNSLKDEDSCLSLGVSAALMKAEAERAERPNEACLCLAIDNAGDDRLRYVHRYLSINKTVYTTRKFQECLLIEEIGRFLEEFLTGAIQ